MATGTVTQTFFRPEKDQLVVKFQWLASSVSGTLSTVATDANINVLMRGMYCVLGITDPGDTTSPTNNYDIALTDSFGCDVFGSELSNRASGTVQQAMPKIGNAFSARPITTGLSLALTNNTVASASGALYLVFVE